MTTKQRKALNVSSIGKIALQTENRTSYNIVGLVLFLEGTLQTTEVIELFHQRVLPRFPRFSSTVKNYKWTEIPNYDCSSHVSINNKNLGLNFVSIVIIKV